MRKKMISAGLETMYFVGAHHALKPFFAGVGAILTFHHVRPPRADAFQPNDLLEITPDFLDAVLASLREADIDIVSLDEVHRRLAERDFGKRFVALTFDDGYRDNREFALPILKRHDAPFTLFVPSIFAEGNGELWWVALERVIAGNEHITLVMNGAGAPLRLLDPGSQGERPTTRSIGGSAPSTTSAISAASSTISPSATASTPRRSATSCAWIGRSSPNWRATRWSRSAPTRSTT